VSGGSGPPRPCAGLALARRFFAEVVEPLVQEPQLRFAAALIGDGSEVLGYDDEISTDHDWGPRVLLFLDESDYPGHAPRILDRLETRLPERFESRPVRFEDQDRFVGLNTRAGLSGSESHGVEVHTLAGWIHRELGVDIAHRDPLPAEWRRLDEQKLLSVTAGEVFRDDLGELAALRRRLSFYPSDLRLERMADLWSEAAGEMPFVGRAGDVGDELGSRILAARLVERAMRLCFLIDGRYAPYSKWLGTAWADLPSAPFLRPHLETALAAIGWREREAALGAAFMAAAKRHLEAGLPGCFEPVLGRYFTRPYEVINADDIASAIRREIQSKGGDR
jgi:hypothetical protein